MNSLSFYLISSFANGIRMKHYSWREIGEKICVTFVVVGFIVFINSVCSGETKNERRKKKSDKSRIMSNLLSKHLKFYCECIMKCYSRSRLFLSLPPYIVMHHIGFLRIQIIFVLFVCVAFNLFVCFSSTAVFVLPLQDAKSIILKRYTMLFLPHLYLGHECVGVFV